MSAYRYTTHSERRVNEEPVPDVLEDFLSTQQLESIAELESQNWFLWFLRRAPGQTPIPFLFDLELGSVAILNSDGSLDRDHGLPFRWDFFY